MAQRRRSKKWLYWTVFLVLLIVAGVIAYLVWDNYFNKKGDGVEQSATSQAEGQPKEKTTADEERDPTDDGEAEEKKTKQYEGEDPNKAAELSGAVTYAGVNGDKLTIRVNIDQYVKNGACSLGLRREGMNIYSAEARIINNATTSTCEGFDVPVAGLGSGDTVIVIYLNSEDKTGEIHGEVRI